MTQAFRSFSLPAALAAALLSIVACAGPPGAPASPAAGSAESSRLHALFDAAWDADMERFPEWATEVGDNRFGGRLHDASATTEAGEYAQARWLLAAAQALPRDALAPKDQTSLDLFIYEQQETLRFEPLVGYRRMTLRALSGFQREFAALLQGSPVATAADAEKMLARMAAYPRRVEQELVRLREGQALGWVPPRAVLERVLQTLDAQLDATADASPFYPPFTALGAAISPSEQAALRARAKQAIAAQVLPAQRRLREFVGAAYLAAAPADGAFSGYPGGAAVYAALVRRETTTELGAAEIHAIGRREMARLRGEIDTVMRAMKWSGDFKSFVQHLNTDPQYFHSSGEALLTAYRDIAKRIDAELPRLFAELPRATYGVRPMAAFAGPDAAPYYDGPALDGSRPGWFNANVEGFRARPKWGQETLTAHEAVPGHHLQNARAAELGELPKFRRARWFTAFGEGWAVYAETLGFDLGLYTEPASRFGHLQMQALRAARLVVDTGIHAMGWGRQQAIDYLVDQTGLPLGYVESEVDRYTSNPGQALGYMIGKLKIDELRDRARSRLGGRFDIRRFHMVVLDQGAVPLTLLERQVDDWIAAEQARR